MLANYGFLLLLLCVICSAYGFLASIAAAWQRHRRLFRSAKVALSCTCALAVLASLILWYSLFTRDFSIQYIFKNTSTDLPIFYTFTAFWSSLEGSHMLWTLFVTICATVAIWTYHPNNEHIMPYVSAALQIVICWMYYLAITHSDIFAVALPIPPEGRGMNTLLQNIYMAIHPPMLFIGYTTLAVPFAYSIAALCYGDITQGWLKTVRRWTLVSWCFLTGAIILGGRWAYVELGWGGYWAWDPVENSSFMPWLMNTALLHCYLIQGKLGQLKRLSIILAIFAFFLSFFGTFITRSGIITSVHAFGEGPIGPNYLLFLALLLFVSSVIFAVRSPSILPPETDKVWGVSKESALVVTLLLVLSFAAIVFVGTIFPIATEAITGQRISIQAPYFNVFAPYIGFATMAAIAVGNLLHYQSPKIKDGAKIMLASGVVAIFPSIGFIYLGQVLQTISTYALFAQLIGIYLAFWAASCLSIDLFFRIRAQRFKLITFLKNNLAYFGAFIAHIGFLIGILGFLGNYRGLEKQAHLKAEDQVELFGYHFKFKDGIQIRQEENTTLFEAPIEVTKDNSPQKNMLYPARGKYPTSADLMHETAVSSSLWRDIYLVLADFDKSTGKDITLKIHINPTVRFVWIAAFVMVIGGFIAVCDPRRADRTRDALTSLGNT